MGYSPSLGVGVEGIAFDGFVGATDFCGSDGFSVVGGCWRFWLFAGGVSVLVSDSSFCPSVSLRFFGVMKGIDKNRHKNRKIPAFHLVSLVSTFPAPAPKRASVAPPPKAVPRPASFLGNCTSTNRTKKRELRNRITVKKGLRNSNKETRLSIKASIIIFSFECC